MVTETSEQVTTEQVTTAEVPAIETKTKEAKAETEVTEVEDTETKETEPTEEPITFKTQAELDKHLEKKAQSLANSIADKSTATYQEQIKGLKQQLKEATFIKEDDALSRLEKSQSEEWGETQDVGDFQEAVKKLIKETRSFNQTKENWEEGHQKATQSVREVNAFTDALALLLPEDDAGFISNLTALAEKIAGAQTDREKELLIELEKVKLQALAEAKPEKPKRTKPDSNLGSAPGGTDITKLSARELLLRGFSKEK